MWGRTPGGQPATAVIERKSGGGLEAGRSGEDERRGDLRADAAATAAGFVLHARPHLERAVDRVPAPAAAGRVREPVRNALETQYHAVLTAFQTGAAEPLAKRICQSFDFLRGWPISPPPPLQP